MTSTRDTIAKLYDQACAEAVAYVEELARTILAQHPNLDEYIMGMGCAMFTVKESRIGTPGLPGYDSIHPDERAYMRTLSNFLADWDSVLKITGEPMRFTATGEKQTVW